MVELLSIKHEEGEGQFDRLKWSDELYSGEFQDLTISGLCSEKNVEPLLPSLRGQQPCTSLTTQVDHPLSSDVLQVSCFITVTLKHSSSCPNIFTVGIISIHCLLYEVKRKEKKKIDA